ncbi:hypothetical protein [Candidatus Uabimicrobium amorphum]|uniref:Uncharacterized protein n=1 Tax=Uabimicrobium amorphum TaxID=2596890 RepID=A0A5S9IIR0_UABAM|nr:hypothetical protein [Candidatus Uabimicrobium amorphum]BBM81800.1 hypothetical protein UABAM_00139 [Candidatus Uabimicrobium amorphum]
MSEDKKRVEERQHYMMAWFCSVLLFFLLGGWFLSTATNALFLANGMWAILLFLYALCSASYHCYYRIFPYVGERRLLIFADLAFIFVCTLLQFPIFVILILLNTQITLLLLSIRLETPAPKKLFLSYLLLLIVLCLVLSETVTHKMISFVVLFCGESIFILSLWYGFAFLLENNNVVWRNKIREIQENRIVDYFAQHKELRSLQKASNTASKGLKHQQRSLLLYKNFYKILRDPQQYTIYQNLCPDSLGEIFSLESKNLVVDNSREIKIEEYLNEIHQNLPHEAQQLKIQRDDNVDEMITLPLEPGMSWIFYQWLYFFNDDKELFVVISDDDETLSFKCIAKANISPSSCDEDTCPECGKKVRSLYSVYLKDLACSQCCRKILENRVRGDAIELEMVKKILSYYKMGSIQCGISSWDNHEYFITVQVKKVSYEKNETSQ